MKKIAAQQPLLVYTGMVYLSYLGMDPHSHFGGHSIIIFGVDKEKELFYVSDRDHADVPIQTPKQMIHKDYHLVSFKEMELARSSKFRPFPANNQAIEIDLTDFQGITSEIIQRAILSTCHKMLYPVAKLKGIRGIEKFSQQVLLWKKVNGKLWELRTSFKLTNVEVLEAGFAEKCLVFFIGKQSNSKEVCYCRNRQQLCGSCR